MATTRFDDNPAGAPIGAAVAWQAPAWVAATTYTAGQYVQVGGVVYVATATSTPGTPPPAAGWAIATNPQPLQSAFTNGGFYPQPPAANPPTPNCAFDTPDAQSVAATSGVYIPAPGEGWVTCSGVGFLQLNLTGSAWTTIHTFAATGAVYVVADGTTVRFANTTGAAVTFTFYRRIGSR